MTPETDPAVLAKAILDAVNGGQWALVAVLGVLGLTALARKFGGRIPKVGPWLASPVGASVVAVVGSVAGALGTAFLAGTPFTWGLVLQALGVAVVALLPSAAATKAAGQAAQTKAELEAVPVTADERVSGYFGAPTEADKARYAEKMTADGYVEAPPGSGNWQRARR